MHLPLLRPSAAPCGKAETMNKLLGISLIAALAFVGIVPAPAAAAETCVLETDICVCTPIVPCYTECSPATECVPCYRGQNCPVDCSPATQCADAEVRNNGDGTYTVTVTYCTDEFNCNSVSRTVNADPCDAAPQACNVSGLCFTYNPSALTNLCLTTGSDPTTVGHPTVGTTSRETCVIGEEVCATHAWPTVGSGSTTLNLPTVDGYVEATVLCVGGVVPCRVTLP